MADKRIKDLTNTATEADLVAGNYFALDGIAGTKKLNSTTLLTKTAQNALAGNAAIVFVPNITNAIAGNIYLYNGTIYKAKENYNGNWDASKFEQVILGNIASRIKILPMFKKVQELGFENSSITNNGAVYDANRISSGVIDVEEGDLFECDETYRWHAIWYYSSSTWTVLLPLTATKYMVPSGVSKIFISYRIDDGSNLGTGTNCLVRFTPNNKANKITTGSVDNLKELSSPSNVYSKVSDLYWEHTRVMSGGGIVLDDDADRISSGVIDVSEGDFFECDETYRWHSIWYYDGSWSTSKLTQSTSFTVPQGVTKVFISYKIPGAENLGTGLNCLVRRLRAHYNVLGGYFENGNFVPFQLVKAADYHWEYSRVEYGKIVYVNDPDRISSGEIPVSKGDYFACDPVYRWHGIWKHRISQNDWVFANTTHYVVESNVDKVYLAYKTSAADNAGVGLDTMFLTIRNGAGDDNPLWDVLPDGRLYFGLDKSSSPVPYQIRVPIMVSGMVIAKNTSPLVNRWGYHVFEGWNYAGDSRFTALVDKHNIDVNGKPSFEIYFYVGSSHSATAYGNMRVGSDVKDHSFTFDRDKMTALGEIDMRSVATFARISPSNDLISCNSVAEADSLYEPETYSVQNAKCLLYLALRDASNGATFYDTDRDKLVCKIDGKWCDIQYTDASQYYNF